MRRLTIITLTLALTGAAFTPIVQARQTDTPIMGRTDPEKYAVAKNCHGGAGTLKYMVLMESPLFQSRYMFLHRGIACPQSGLGEHDQRGLEEMFITLDGPMHFTVNGHTSILPARSIVVLKSRLGGSHSFYNPTDRDVNYFNLGVSANSPTHHYIEFNTDLTKLQVESPPQFEWAVADPTLLKPVENYRGGKGTVMFRTIWDHNYFESNWYSIEHFLVPPGSSVGNHRHNGSEEVWYVLDGAGRAVVNDHPLDVRKGDAIPCTLGDAHGIVNTGATDLEVLVISVAMQKDVRDIEVLNDDLTSR